MSNPGVQSWSTKDSDDQRLRVTRSLDRFHVEVESDSHWAVMVLTREAAAALADWIARMNKEQA